MTTPKPLPFDPLPLMTGWWRMWGEAQMNWFSMWQKAVTGGMTGLPSWPGLAGKGLPYPPANLAALMAGFMPQVNARITPLETKGPLSGAAEAARLSMRMSLPSGCLGPAEMMMVEAIIARAPADAPLLKDAADKLLPGGKG